MNVSGEVRALNTNNAQSCSRLLNMPSLVTEVRKCLLIMKISSLSTIVHKYITLSISSLPFKDLILRAAENNDAAGDSAWKISRTLKEFIESNHNLSQIQAINGLQRNMLNWLHT